MYFLKNFCVAVILFLSSWCGVFASDSISLLQFESALRASLSSVSTFYLSGFLSSSSYRQDKNAWVTTLRPGVYGYLGDKAFFINRNYVGDTLGHYYYTDGTKTFDFELGDKDKGGLVVVTSGPFPPVLSMFHLLPYHYLQKFKENQLSLSNTTGWNFKEKNRDLYVYQAMISVVSTSFSLVVDPSLGFSVVSAEYRTAQGLIIKYSYENFTTINGVYFPTRAVQDNYDVTKQNQFFGHLLADYKEIYINEKLPDEYINPPIKEGKTIADNRFDMLVTYPYKKNLTNEGIFEIAEKQLNQMHKVGIQDISFGWVIGAFLGLVFILGVIRYFYRKLFS